MKAKQHSWGSLTRLAQDSPGQRGGGQGTFFETSKNHCLFFKEIDHPISVQYQSDALGIKSKITIGD